MKILRTIRNYFCYCGIEKSEYNKVKKSAYVSNFETWKILHILMDVAFAALSISALFNEFMGINKYFYIAAFAYSALATVLFFVLKKDRLLGQFVIYLSISVLLLFGCFIASNKDNIPAITFIAFILITPMFMIDKPYFMSLELVIASTIFVIWMYYVKDYDMWIIDLTDAICFTIIGIFIHIISNSLRIKEFVLIRKINIQKDIDDLTGLKNKAALTEGINDFIRSPNNNKGLFIVLDIDHFKAFNDTYGHDVGDEILMELGKFFQEKFTGDEIVGRFGGDEFIVFIKNINDVESAQRIASEIYEEAAESIKLPDDKKIGLSMGIAIYSGVEKHYSEIFKKADIALYKTKADRKIRFSISE